MGSPSFDSKDPTAIDSSTIAAPQRSSMSPSAGEDDAGTGLAAPPTGEEETTPPLDDTETEGRDAAEAPPTGEGFSDEASPGGQIERNVEGLEQGDTEVDEDEDEDDDDDVVIVVDSDDDVSSSLSFLSPFLVMKLIDLRPCQDVTIIVIM